MARIEHILTHQTAPLSNLLSHELRLSPEQTKHLLWLGAIYCNKVRLECPQNQHVDPLIEQGSYLRIHTEPKRFPLDHEKLRQCIVAETKNYLVLSKPAGLPVHPTLDNQQENALSALQEILGNKLFVTHRLDVGTSGLLLFAKTPQEQTRLNELFRTSQMTKIYQALVQGTQAPPRGEVIHWMKPSDRAPREVQTTEVEGWLNCRLRILEIMSHAEGFQLRIELLTGRTHQIRAQLAQIGFPILGDQMYGSTKIFADSAHDHWALRCVKLQFKDADGELKTYSDFN